jgi:hypothetical protein
MPKYKAIEEIFQRNGIKVNGQETWDTIESQAFQEDIIGRKSIDMKFDKDGKKVTAQFKINVKRGYDKSRDIEYIDMDIEGIIFPVHIL